MLPKKLVRQLISKPVRRAPPEILLPMESTGKLPRYRLRGSEKRDSLIGVRISDYYVLGIVGHGGMSVVYRAKRLKKRGRVVAIKTLRMERADNERLRDRFVREAELLSKLNHPGIVQVHDHGETKRGQPYFVMDYLQGANLDERIREDGFLTAMVVRHIFTQVCDAVDHAHRCGVIHRDLKPSNIMLMTIEGRRDCAKVVDFGIARFQEDAQRFTRQGELWGSPIYMSPEQCSGGELDSRSDIYSLGISLYESLTGKVPFRGKNYADTLAKQIDEPPLPPRKARADLDIPEKLENVVLKALNKKPEFRQQTMAELGKEISDAVSVPLTLAAASIPVNLNAQDPALLRESQHKRWIGVEWIKLGLSSVFICGMLYGEYLVIRHWVEDLWSHRAKPTAAVTVPKKVEIEKPPPPVIKKPEPPKKHRRHHK